jgi:hypothetical protein
MQKLPVTARLLIVLISAGQGGADWSAVLSRELRQAVNERISVEVRLQAGEPGDESAADALVAGGAAVVRVEVPKTPTLPVRIRVKAPGDERWQTRAMRFAPEDPAHERMRAVGFTAGAMLPVVYAAKHRALARASEPETPAIPEQPRPAAPDSARRSLELAPATAVTDSTHSAPDAATLDSRSTQPATAAATDSTRAAQPASPAATDSTRAAQPASAAVADSTRAAQPASPAATDSTRAAQPASPAATDSTRAAQPASPAVTDSTLGCADDPSGNRRAGACPPPGRGQTAAPLERSAVDGGFAETAAGDKPPPYGIQPGAAASAVAALPPAVTLSPEPSAPSTFSLEASFHGAATVGASSPSAGAALTLQWHAFPAFALRATAALGAGALPEITEARYTELFAGAGAAWTPWVATPAHRLGAALCLDLGAQQLTIVREDHADSRSRWLPAVKPRFEASLAATQHLAFALSVGATLALGDTAVVVAQAEAAHLSPVTLFTELGLRWVF